MANKVEVKDLLDAGVHFGHLTRRWNPNMAPYVYMERNGIHIINLYKTAAKMQEAGEALKKIAASGRKILFVATKKQAKEIVTDLAVKANMPYITERWPGGMLTNFVTIRKAVKKMATIDRMKKDGTFNTLSKKERLQVDRLRAKLEKNLGSIVDMSRLPAAVFVVDIMREHIAIKEAQKLNIPIFAMVDTNSDPREVDYVIPSNDDASKSIEKVVSYLSESIVEGLSERKSSKESKEGEEKEEKTSKTPRAKKAKEDVAVPAAAPEAKVAKEEVTAEVKSESKKETEEKPASEAKVAKEEVTAEVKPESKKETEKKPASEAKAAKEEVKEEVKTESKKETKKKPASETEEEK
ncbi:MAG TPA: 30S ribosomal protein S2 [Gillisia sp.]|nr:30S ribosomal protein S2 [Gillisia sp.]